MTKRTASRAAGVRRSREVEAATTSSDLLQDQLQERHGQKRIKSETKTEPATDQARESQRQQRVQGVGPADDHAANITGVGSATSSNTRGASDSSMVRPPHVSGAKLSDIGERLVLAFLSYLPDRITVEQVCKRWRSLSKNEIPIHEIDFSKVSARRLTKDHFKTLLSRANGHLHRITLPSIAMDASCFEALKQHTDLRHLCAEILLRHQLFGILRACEHAESLEIHQCQLLSFSGWEQQPARFRSVLLHACHSMTTASVSSLIAHCGEKLKVLVLTGAQNVDSSVMKTLATHAHELEELVLSYSKEIRLQDLHALTQARWQTLRVLDLSSCVGVGNFPSGTMLPALQVLILDNTKANDDGLRSIAAVASQLKYLSLQDCRCITDEGLVDLSSPHEGCVGLELLDLKGTRVTDIGVASLTTGCPHLRMLRLDSCRNVSRELRLQHGEQTRALLTKRLLTVYERLAVSRISSPEHAAVAMSKDSSSESEVESDASYFDSE